MQSLLKELERRVQAALAIACGPEGQSADPQVKGSTDNRFGDYQSNCAMALAKRLGAQPRELAGRIVDALEVADMCPAPELAGPGFINFKILPAHLAKRLAEIPARNAGQQYDRLGVEFGEPPVTVVVDMSSPNLAKEMHVGHMRSAIIGECVSRALEFAGNNVIRVNHVGDWGTQFGMLIAHLQLARPEAAADPDRLKIGDLEKFYVEAKQHFDSDPAFADAARRSVVSLQAGDEKVLQVWRAFCQESLRHCHQIYERFGIKNLIDRGESFYNDRLADTVAALAEKGLVAKSEGADCIFVPGFESRDGSPDPMMVRKSDGGYLYATTDLAAGRYRIFDLGAKRVLYVVGIPQARHLDKLFAVLRMAGWAADDVELVHLKFGNILDLAGRPFKTRDGQTIKLRDLLDEAVARARRVVQAAQTAKETDAPLSAAQMDQVAEIVGISAIKYFELSHALTTDYRFDWDVALSLDGNTAPYMLYAYARIRSIGRKAGIDFETLPADAPIHVEHESEIALAKAIMRFAESVEVMVKDLRPNVMTEYLFDLSKTFSRFYDRRHGVRVIDAESDALRLSRLKLCALTARVLRSGLQLLGIETLEKM